MKKENILFAIVGLFIGFFGGFFLANNLNRNTVSQTDAAQISSNLPIQNPQTQTVDIKESQKQAAMMPEIAQTLETAGKEPDNFEAQVKAGDMYAKIQKFDEAVKFYEKALQNKPDDYNAIIKTGNTYFDSKQFDNAQKWYLKALEKKPADINVRTDLGITFVESEKPDLERAVREFQIALQTNPTYEPTLYNLGVAYFKKNDLEQANRVLTRLEETNPQSRLVERLRQILALVGQTLGIRLEGNRRARRLADLRRLSTHAYFSRLVGQKLGVFRHCRISSGDFHVSRRQLFASRTAQLRLRKRNFNKFSSCSFQLNREI